MKNLNLKSILLISATFMFLNCASEEIEVTEKNNQNVIQSTQKINSTSWKVQTLGNGNRDFFTNVKGRYTYSDSKLYMKVVKDDQPIGGKPRTELRSTSANFSTNSSHQLNVSMNILKSTTKVVIGQIFSDDLGDDYGQILLKSKKLYARFDGKKEVLLGSVGSSVSFSISTSGGTTTISGAGKSTSDKRSVGGCYFKTGVYLLDGGSAEVEITNLSKS